MKPEELSAALAQAKADGAAEATALAAYAARSRARRRAVTADAADKYQRTWQPRGRLAPLAQDVSRKVAGVCPPVFPNAGVTQWYTVQLLAFLAQMQDELLPLVRKAYNDSEAVLGMASDASRTDLLQKALEKWGGLWVKRLDRMSLTLADKFADKAVTVTDKQLAASFRQGGLTVKFRPTRASMEAYKAISAENVALIKSIPAQYAKDVQTQIWASVQKGGDLATLTEALKQRYGVAQRRAELIARDQNAKAKATIEQTRRKELGVTKAIWMHSHAGKEPRPTHVKMNGKPFDIERGMYDSDEQEYILPGQLVNCKCTSRAVIPGFE